MDEDLRGNPYSAGELFVTFGERVSVPGANAVNQEAGADVSGPGPLNPDGSLRGPFGRVGADVSQEEGYEAARGCALSVLASLKRDLGDLDRVTAWLVVNGFSDLVLELYGPEAGMHARTAPGVATLPLNHAVFVSAEVEIKT